MDLKEEFNAAYATALSKEGFVYNKKYDMHVRFVNGELFQYIRYMKRPWYRRGYKEFTVYAGIVSVYAYSLLKKELTQCGNGLSGYAALLFGVPGVEQSYAYNNENMKELIELSLEQTCKYIVPVFNQVADLDSYIEFCKEIEIELLRGADKYDRGQNDALVLIQAENHDDFEDFFHKCLDFDMKTRKELTGTIEEGYYEAEYDLMYDGIIESIAKARDIVYNNPKLYAEALEELKRRKEANLATLKRNGVI